MPQIKEVADRGENPGFPTIKQMRESQQAGSVGAGTDKPYADKMAAQNLGTGIEGQDEEFTKSNEDDGEGSTLPWE